MSGTTIRLKALSWHQWLALFGGLALLLWGSSGLVHITLSSFGPQVAVFLPPERPLDLEGARPLHETLAEAGISEAAAIKLVVGEEENLLQVTTLPDAPRRYFRLDSGEELPGHDQRHAVFLARHHAGLPEADVLSVTQVTAFSDAYPAVNRLLPVWRVRFDRDDGLTYWVHTETGAIAAVSNDWKAGAQRLFQGLHSWNWLKGQAESLRVLLVGALVSTLLALSVSGMVMLWTSRHKARGRRRWHRRAGWVLGLPLICFSATGVWHLVQNGWAEPGRTLTLSAPMQVPAQGWALTQQWPEIADGLDVRGVSLVETVDGQKLYRLALAPQANPQGADAIRTARFDGVSTTGPALYLDAVTGTPWLPGDKELALQLGERFTGLDRGHVRSARLITSFGPGYDFRNKRLPVWALDYGAPLKATLFVDTATGVLADRAFQSQKIETWGFSLFHKWNMLFPLGRAVQNAVIAAVVLACLVLLAGIGLSLWWQRRSRLKPAKRGNEGAAMV
jgi:uncharacterized iron-regulated membrane protein